MNDEESVDIKQTDLLWIDLIPAPSFICDRAGTVRAINRHAVNFFGIKPRSHSLTKVMAFISPSSADSYLDQWNSRESTTSPDDLQRPPLLVRTANGRVDSVNLSIGTLTTAGELKYLLVFSDPQVSNPTSANQMIKFAGYLSTVRHEFRNPLSGLMVSTEVLLKNVEANLSPVQMSHLDGIREALTRMARMIEGIQLPREEFVNIPDLGIKNRRNLGQFWSV